MSINQNRSVKMTFVYANENDQSPIVTIFNATDLIPSLSDQIARYGLRYTTLKRETMAGQLRGSRASFEAMVESYGFTISSPGPETH
jgi:hypothetical protein